MDYVISISGLALLLAPWLLRYTDSSAATVSSIVLGFVVLLAAGYRAIRRDEKRWETWIVAAAGVCAVVAPFVFAFPRPALLASGAVGVIVTALAAIQLFMTTGAGARPLAAR